MIDSSLRNRRDWFTAQPREYTISHGLEHLPRYGGFVIPPFQRGIVWTQQQSIRFIESIWTGLPIGSYCVNVSDDMSGAYDRWLLDGQQRWNAIFTYAADEFEVYGYRFSELHEYDRRAFRNFGFTCLQCRSDDEATLREIFERLAYGGTPNVRAGE